jgi:hypothetical protein
MLRETSGEMLVDPAPQQFRADEQLTLTPKLADESAP